MRLELEVGRAGAEGLAQDYLEGNPSATRFYEGWWGDTRAYLAKAEEVGSRFSEAARERLAGAFHSPAPDAADRLTEWVRRGGYVVTTGQQPGLFTGPLYTIYKALSAARLARSLESLTGAPVLPLFWVASEDHDWEEAAETFVIGVENELRRIALEAPAGQLGRALHRIPADSQVADALHALLAALPETDFSSRYRELLLGAYAPGQTLAEAFRTVLAELLAPFGVFLVDAADPVVKESSRPLLERELAESAEHEKLLLQRSEALEDAGYAPQVPLLPGAANLFLEGPAGRERLYREGSGFVLRRSGERLRPDQVRARLANDPRSLSPNVLLRPVVETAVFPSLSTVAGPGEVAYFAQLQPYFQTYRLRPPVVYPRFTFTVVESKIRKVLDKFALEAAALQRPFHELASLVAQSEVPEGVRGALARLREGVERDGAALLEASLAVDVTLRSPVERAAHASLDAWADAEKRVVQALKRQNESRLAQLEKARLHLFPQGKPQERVLNAFYYLFRYGARFLEEVADGCTVELNPAQAASATAEPAAPAAAPRP